MSGALWRSSGIASNCPFREPVSFSADVGEAVEHNSVALNQKAYEDPLRRRNFPNFGVFPFARPRAKSLGVFHTHLPFSPRSAISRSLYVPFFYGLTSGGVRGSRRRGSSFSGRPTLFWRGPQGSPPHRDATRRTAVAFSRASRGVSDNGAVRAAYATYHIPHE